MAETWEGEWHRVFDAAGIRQEQFNGRLLLWLNGVQGRTFTSLVEAQQAYATGQGAYNWSSLVGAASFPAYVNSAAANDNGDGYTLATAKKTLAAGQALIGAGRRKLVLVDDSLWREQLNPPPRTTVQRSGGGAMPEIRALDVAANGSFSASGVGNAYQITWAHNITPSSVVFISVHEDGVKLVRAASQAACGSTPGSFYTVDVTAGSSQTVYVNPTGGGDITSNGKVYEITKRDHCVQGYVDSLVIDGVKMTGHAHNDGALKAGPNAYIRNCSFNYGKKHNAFIESGTFEDCTAFGIEDAGASFVAYKSDPAGLTATFRRCTANGTMPGGATGGTAVGFLTHGTGGGNSFAVVTLEDCIATKLGGACTPGGVINVISGMKTTDVKKITTTDVGNLYIFSRNYFDGRGSVAGWDPANSFIQANGSAAFYGNVFLMGERTANVVCILGIFDTLGQTITAIQNTFVENTSTAAKGIQVQGAAASAAVLSQNNVFYGIQTIYARGGTPTVSVSADNNIYFTSAGTLTFLQGTTSYSGFSNWVATGQDSSGRNIDPTFANAISGWDERADAVANHATVAALQAGALNYPGVNSAPTNVTAPTIGGSNLVGQTLTVVRGIYNGFPIPTLSWAWTADGAVLPGETGPSLLVTSAMVGKQISLTETATSAAGAISTASSTVTDAIIASFDPSQLFASGQEGGYYDISDITTLFQDTAGTIPVTTTGQTVGKVLDKSGRGRHLVAPSDAQRPIYTVNGALKYLLFDGSDDYMTESGSPSSIVKPLTLAAAANCGVSGNKIIVGDTLRTEIAINTVGGNLFAGGSSISTSGLSTSVNVDRVFVGVNNGDTTSSVSVNNLQTVTGNPGTNNLTKIGIMGTGAGGGNLRSTGRFYAGVVRGGGNLTVYQMTNLKNWLAAKMGITI